MDNLSDDIEETLSEIQSGLQTIDEGIDRAIEELKITKSAINDLACLVETTQDVVLSYFSIDKETRDMIVRVVKDRKESLENDRTIDNPIVFHKFELADCYDILDILSEE